MLNFMMVNAYERINARLNANEDKLWPRRLVLPRRSGLRQGLGERVRENRRGDLELPRTNVFAKGFGLGVETHRFGSPPVQ